MRLDISHNTLYRYEPPAHRVIQLLRVTPGNHDGQYVVEWRVDISTDAHVSVRPDAFGNLTHIFSSDGPLDQIAIHVEGRIETQDTSGVLRGAAEPFPPSLYLRSTTLTQSDKTMRELSRTIHDEARGDALGFLHALMVELNERMTFDTDPTHAGTSAIEAFALGQGVCQDFAHIFIACARAMNIPARYAAGHFLRADGKVHQEAGHAWAEAYVPHIGWVGFDAANGLCTTPSHVRVAMALDALGAAPVRGSRFGGGTEMLSVNVLVDHAGRQTQS